MFGKKKNKKPAPVAPSISSRNDNDDGVVSMLALGAILDSSSSVSSCISDSSSSYSSCEYSISSSDWSSGGGDSGGGGADSSW